MLLHSVFRLFLFLINLLILLYPVFQSGQNFLIPDASGGIQDRPEEAKIAKRRLQGLNNSVFEELSMDVYDEVDRRETDAIW